MNWKIINRSIFVTMVTLLVISCDQNNLEPLENNSTPPGKVENVTVENLPGKAKLTYTLPSNQDLLYVKAEYTLASGRKMEVKASYYNNTLLLEGFADTDEHNVTLYAVNRSETASEPVVVKIKPLEASMWSVYRSLETGAAFGGIYVKATNLTRENLSILIMQKDVQGDWVVNPRSIYTSTDVINKTVRGFKPVSQNFAITIRDRWLNTTDTIFTSIAPLEEFALPKSGYKHFPLPGDTKTHTAAVPSGMWDGNIMDWPKVFLTDGTVQGQHMVTIDTGVLKRMSRIVIWDYPEYFNNGRMYYYTGDLKEFEIWGSANPNPDGSLNGSWVKLGKYNAVKPSGLPFGEQTAEDYNTAVAGFSWDFDATAPPIRYLRIISLKNWGGLGTMAIGEIQVYGAN